MKVVFYSASVTKFIFSYFIDFHVSSPYDHRKRKRHYIQIVEFNELLKDTSLGV
jgi:hypothetical protein